MDQGIMGINRSEAVTTEDEKTEAHLREKISSTGFTFRSKKRISAEPRLNGKGRIAGNIFLVASIGAILGILVGLILADVAEITGKFTPVFAVLIGALAGISIIASRWLALKTRSRKNRIEALAIRLESMEDLSWEIRENEERYRSITEAFGDLVVHRDQTGRIMFANDAFYQTFKDQITCSQSSDAQYFRLEQASNSHCDTVAREIQMPTIDGLRWFSWLDLSTRDRETGTSAIISVARDITDQKEHEAALELAITKAEEASQAKSRFVAHVSHEIRTPLNGILGMADLLKHTELSPPQKSYVDAVETSGYALLSLVEDVLQLAKVEASQLKMQPEPFSIRLLAESVIELLAGTAYAKNLEIACIVTSDVPSQIIVDKGKLRQVILNIVGNAIKFTEKGGVVLKVSSNMPSANSGQANIRVEIIDTGPGLAREDCERIFEAFEQADNGRTRKHEGVGLGLNISQQIIAEMGGQIELESTPGKGSVFTFELDVPVHKSAVPAEKPSRVKDNPVLLLSPNGVEQSAIREILVETGYNVNTCETVDSATATLKLNNGLQRPISSIIIDLRIFDPGVEQLGIFQEAAGNPLRKIALVSPEKHLEVDNLLAHGMDGWIVRPARAGSIIDVLARMDHPGPGVVSGEIHRTTTTDHPIAPLNILLVEDNEINQMLTCALLERSDHQVTIADNGRLAIESYEKSLQKNGNKFNLILMDLHMPDMDGFAAIHQIRNIESGKNISPTAILVLSADEQQGIRIKSQEAGANGFLSKPIDIKRLNDAIFNVPELSEVN